MPRISKNKIVGTNSDTPNFVGLEKNIEKEKQQQQ